MSLRNGWKIALLIWLAIVLLSSTREVGSLGAAVFSRYLRDAARPLGISSHDAQKLLHVVLFAVLGWLLAATRLPPASPWLRGLLWSFGIGALTELIQLAVRGRHPLFSDVILNGVTGTLGCWLALWWSSRRQTLEPDKSN
jgi:VanZ family protein